MTPLWRCWHRNSKASKREGRKPLFSLSIPFCTLEYIK
nr:MAG TPA: hypothetical protein [Caudoviricetes sp.]